MDINKVDVKLGRGHKAHNQQPALTMFKHSASSVSGHCATSRRFDDISTEHIPPAEYTSPCTRAMSHLRSAEAARLPSLPCLLCPPSSGHVAAVAGARQRNLHCVHQLRAASWPPPSPATNQSPPPPPTPAAFSVLMQNFP